MTEAASVYERLTAGDRKLRKDLQRRLYSNHPGLDVVHANAAGIDIGNESHFGSASGEDVGGSPCECGVTGSYRGGETRVHLDAEREVKACRGKPGLGQLSLCRCPRSSRQHNELRLIRRLTAPPPPWSSCAPP